MKALTKTAEKQILASIKEMCQHVDSGVTPTEALSKVATANAFPLDTIRLIARGYNTGYGNSQRESEKTALAKFASFPIADAEAVVKELYPTGATKPANLELLTGVSEEYYKPVINKQGSPDQLMSQKSAGFDLKSLLGTAEVPYNPAVPDDQVPNIVEYLRNQGSTDVRRDAESNYAFRNAEGTPQIWGREENKYYPVDEEEYNDPERRKNLLSPEEEAMLMAQGGKAADFNLDILKVKVAKSNKRSPVGQAQKALSDVQAMKRAFEEKRLEVSFYRDSLLGELAALNGYFKQGSSPPFSAGEISYAARELGQLGPMVVTKAAQHEPVQVAPKAAINWEQSPFCHVKRAVELSRLVSRGNKELAELDTKNTKKATDTLRPFVETLSSDAAQMTVLGVEIPAEETKTSSFLGMALGSTLGRSLASTAVGNPKGNDQLVNDMKDDLTDPNHEDEMNKIRAQAILGDMLGNDEVISGYEPDEVYDAYNEFSSLSPRSALQPAIVRPWLRKRLTQGGVEPFEAGEMANVEKTLAQTEGMSGGGTDLSNIGKMSNVLRERNPILG